MAKLVVIIQCDIVQKKCVGYACMKSFYERSGRFTGYDADTKYMKVPFVWILINKVLYF